MISAAQLLPAFAKETVRLGRQQFIALQDAKRRFPESFAGLPEQLSPRTSLLFGPVITRRISDVRAAAVFRLEQFKLGLVPGRNDLYRLDRISIESHPEGGESQTGHFSLIALPATGLEEDGDALAAALKNVVRARVSRFFPPQLSGGTGWSSRISEPDEADVRSKFQRTLDIKIRRANLAIVEVQARIINGEL